MDFFLSRAKSGRLSALLGGPRRSGVAPAQQAAAFWVRAYTANIHRPPPPPGRMQGAATPYILPGGGQVVGAEAQAGERCPLAAPPFCIFYAFLLFFWRALGCIALFCALRARLPIVLGWAKLGR